jgi:4-amino-4-deoxy-L-arabinose transferase-like glycosyltransferase
VADENSYGKFCAVAPTQENSTKVRVYTISQSVGSIVREQVGEWSQGNEGLQLIIERSSAQFFVLADEQLATDGELWTLIARPTSGLNVIVERKMPSSWWHKLLLGIVELVSRCLLGTRATAWGPTAVQASRATWKEHLSGLNSVNSIPQLVCLIRANGVPVSESVIAVSQPIEQSIKIAEIFRAIGEAAQFWWRTIKFPSHDRTAANRKISGIMELSLWGSLIATAWLVLSLNLGYPLFEPDEARNAQLAMNIVESGEWLSLQLADRPYWDKPPLVAWLTATVYQTIGISEWATRLPGNLAGLGTVLLMFGLGRKVVPAMAAWCGAMCLILSAGFVAGTRYVTMDSVLTCTAFLALISYYLACARGRFYWNWWVVLGVALGLGFLTKGPVILILTIPVIIGHRFLSGRATRPSLKQWGLLGSIIALIAGPWFLAMSIVHPDFLIYFFWKHNVVRFAEAFNHREPWWYYAPVLVIALYPAVYLLPVLGNWLWFNGPDWRKNRSSITGYLSLVIVWIVGFFSMSEAKLPTYILPAFPAMCLLLGVVFEQRILTNGNSLSSRWLAWVPFLAGLGMLTLVVGGLVAVFFLGGFGTRSITIAAGFSLGLAVFLFLLAIKSSVEAVRWGSISALGGLTLIVCFAGVVPRVAEYRSVSLAIRNVRSQPELDGLPVVFVEHEDYGSKLSFQGLPVLSFDQLQSFQAVQYLNAQPAAIVVTKASVLERLGGALRWSRQLTPVPGARHVYLCRDRDFATKIQDENTRTSAFTDDFQR